MTIRVSEAEKSVMDVLWQESPLSSVEVVEKLQSQDWSEKTVKTFLNRLVKKGVVSFQKDGRRYLYSPAIERDEFLADESEGFLDKVFKGNMKELLATFVENKQLSTEELDYLKGLLNDSGSDEPSKGSKGQKLAKEVKDD